MSEIGEVVPVAGFFTNSVRASRTEKKMRNAEISVAVAPSMTAVLRPGCGDCDLCVVAKGRRGATLNAPFVLHGGDSGSDREGDDWIRMSPKGGADIVQTKSDWNPVALFVVIRVVSRVRAYPENGLPP